MSRNHLVESINTMFPSSTQHDLQTAVERAMREGKVIDADGVITSSFHFDIIEFARSITTVPLKREVINGLCFSIDAQIQGAIGRLLNNYYQFSKTDESTTTFPSYQDFLKHVEGIEASEQALYETGCDVRDSIARIHNLLGFRREINDLASLQLLDPSRHVVPDMADLLRKPKVRAISARDELNLQDIAKDEAGSDVDLATELLAQLKLDTQVDRMNQLRMDRMKAEAMAMLYICVTSRPSVTLDEPLTDESDAFYSMDAPTQFRLITSTVTRINDTRRKMALDNRLTTMDKAAMRVEVAKRLLPQLNAALAHPVMVEIAAAQ